MSLTDKILDAAKGQILNSELGKQVTQVGETLGITSLTGKNLSKEETQIQLDLFKENLIKGAKLTNVDGDFDKIIKEAFDNSDGIISELISQGFEKGKFESKTAELIKAFQERKIAHQINKDRNLTALESICMSLVPGAQSVGLSKIAGVGGIFAKLDGAKLQEANKILSEINGDLTGGVTAKNNDGEDSKKETKDGSGLEGYDGTIESLRGKLIWPLKGDDLYITTEQGEFGDDRGDHKHEGIDLGGESDEVIAPHTMKITEIAYQEGVAGNYVKANIEPETSPVVTFKFFHLKEKPNLEIGQIIPQGEAFATEGSTGRSSGEHLHFEIEGDGKARDPLKAFVQTDIKYMQGGKKVDFDEREHADDYRQAA